MKDETVELRIMAFENAAEMIRGQVETGMTNEDCGGDVNAYAQQCVYASKVITRLAERLKKKYGYINI